MNKRSIARKRRPTQEFLKSIMAYDEVTGVFVRDGVECNGLDKDGYIRISVLHRSTLAHHLVWLYVHGRYPIGIMDHINGNKTDNRLVNLREVTSLENSKNIKIGKRNKTGILGVCWDKFRGRWSAEIGKQPKRVKLGRFSDFFQACCARKSAELKYNYHPNHGKR